MEPTLTPEDKQIADLPDGEYITKVRLLCRDKAELLSRADLFLILGMTLGRLSKATGGGDHFRSEPSSNPPAPQ